MKRVLILQDEHKVLPNCPDVDPDGNTLRDPVIEMRHVNNGGETKVIVGGYVYRVDEIPDLEGRYIFGSSVNKIAPTGELFIAEPSGPSGQWEFHEIDLASRGDNLGDL